LSIGPQSVRLSREGLFEESLSPSGSKEFQLLVLAAKYY